MKLYGIRRKSDGFMMPAGRKRGFTHDEPKDPRLNPPRLFPREIHAKAALREWLDGEIVVSTYDAGYGDIKEKWDTIKKLDRIPENMEVVTVYLRIK